MFGSTGGKEPSSPSTSSGGAGAGGAGAAADAWHSAGGAPGSGAGSAAAAAAAGHAGVMQDSLDGSQKVSLAVRDAPGAGLVLWAESAAGAMELERPYAHSTNLDGGWAALSRCGWFSGSHNCKHGLSAHHWLLLLFGDRSVGVWHGDRPVALTSLQWVCADCSGAHTGIASYGFALSTAPFACVLCLPPLQVTPSWCSCGRCAPSARRSWKQAAAPPQHLQLLLAAALQLAVLVLAQQGQGAGECCPALQEVRKYDLGLQAQHTAGRGTCSRSLLVAVTCQATTARLPISFLLLCF